MFGTARIFTCYKFKINQETFENRIIGFFLINLFFILLTPNRISVYLFAGMLFDLWFRSPSL